MDELKQVRMNLAYVRDKENGEMLPVREFVFIVDKAKYDLNNEGEVVRSRSCQEFKFALIGDESFDSFMEVMSKYKESSENDLK